jgi:hypothetical protein
VVLFVAALPIKTGGCGRTACITVSASQLVNGACPSAAVAQARFADTTCGSGAITSVDGAGSLDDGFCCYPVTEGDGNPNGPVECGVGGGMGVTTGTGFFGNGGSITGFGGSGGSGTCSTCSAALSGAVPFGQVCAGPSTLLDALEVCACSATCGSACNPTLCVKNAPDDGCASCLQLACPSQLAACRTN